jgi:hypothetical protein
METSLSLLIIIHETIVCTGIYFYVIYEKK